MTMKRVTQVLYRWRNVSGLFEGPKGIVKVGEIFEATEAQVPQAFRDTIECLGPAAVEPQAPVFAGGGIIKPATVDEPPVIVSEPAVVAVAEADDEIIDDEIIDDEIIEADDEVPVEAEATAEVDTLVDITYTVVARGAGWFDVVDTAGQAVNLSALRLGPANALAEELNNG